MCGSAVRAVHVHLSNLEPKMTVNPVSLPRALVNQLLHQAQSSPDTAIFGLIGGVHGLPTHPYPVTADISLSGARGLPSSKDLERLHLEMHDRGESLFAAFYSDPATPSNSHSIELRAFQGSDCLYIVILLNTKGVLELRGFRQNPEQQIEVVELCLGQD